MKRSLIPALGLLTLAVNAYGQANYTVKIGGKLMGTVTIESKSTAKGGKHDIQTMRTTRGKQTLILRYETFYNADGSMSRKTETLNMVGSPRQAKIDVAFDSKGANVVATAGPQRKQKFLAYPDGKIPKQNDEFWFVRDHPKIGATCHYYSFDTDAVGWKIFDGKYTMDESITVGGRKVKAHKVEGKNGDKKQTVWMDDRGLPYRLTGEDFILERVFK